MNPMDNIEKSASPTPTSSENTAVMGMNETTVPAPQAEDGITLGFFAIGMVINITMIIAYFIWAYKNWNNKKG